MNDMIKLTQVNENNLKNIDVQIPYHKHTVIAGVSGSGKSTLAYDVIYATAQRKLLDCMSDQENRFSTRMKQPAVGSVEGLSTVINLKQVKPNNNPRSTIATYSNIGSYMRSIMAIHGKCKCLYCDEEYKQSNLYTLIKDIEALQENIIVEVCFPYYFHNKSERNYQIDELRKKGYRFVYINDNRLSLRDFIEIDQNISFIMVVEGRFQAAAKLNKSDINCIKNASIHGDKYISITLRGEAKASIDRFYRKHGCIKHHIITLTLEASDFLYNDMSCACPECMGSGIKKTVHPLKVIKNAKKALSQGPFFNDVYPINHPYNYMLLYSLAKHYDVSFDASYEELPKAIKDIIMYGSKGETFILQRPEGYNKALPNYLAKEGELVSFKGILTRLEKLYHEMLIQSTAPSLAQERFFKTYMHEIECPECKGNRLKKIKENILLNGKTYTQLGKMEFSDLIGFLQEIDSNTVSQPVIASLIEKLTLMKKIGLDYLSFNRRIDSLSGGEYQRLRIANQVGSGLVGLTYIIDEPTDGLHGSDNQKIINIIDRLLQKGNTVITIEHDNDLINAADYVIEMGPAAGVNGGEIIATGTPEEIKNNPHSIIGKCLSKNISYNNEACHQYNSEYISIFGIEVNNVINADINIPLNQITCFTGVSGSGKSSIVYEVLYKILYSRLHDNRVIPGKYKSASGLEKIKNIICIDQNFINGKNCSIPATYLDIFDTIRDMFSECENNYDKATYNKSYFSYNSKGACPACKGKGYIESYIQYFGLTKIICSECNGQQYIDEVLEIKYKGKNIKQVIDMTFSEALCFFSDNKVIYDKTKLVCDLGLGYMQLGQQLSTISGGEAQRLKLAREMCRYKNKKNSLYIFDEPSIGLHSTDVEKIICVINKIVENQNTVVLVEHNPDMILSSDCIIDMGPEAGKHGGQVMFCGTPEKLLYNTNSKTAAYLRKYIGIEDEK